MLLDTLKLRGCLNWKVKGKKGRKRMKRKDLMMVTAAKPTASLFLSTEKKDTTGRSPSVCHKLELAAVGICGIAET